MDGRCGIISSCQSAANSEIVKRSRACVHRGAALYQVQDFYLSLPFHTARSMSRDKPENLCILQLPMCECSRADESSESVACVGFCSQRFKLAPAFAGLGGAWPPKEFRSILR